MMTDILSALITVSEKAANIARICRQDSQLLSFLIQEKKETEKNHRFFRDFKTLADVLVQELVKTELSSKFPSLRGHIYGEENNEFESGGETIIIEVKSDQYETRDLLYRILGDLEASETLAKAVHANVESPSLQSVDIPQLRDNIGVWIDPIDSTAEYIRGGLQEEAGVILSGLPCVTVLIGLYDRDTGAPIVGIVNQPFFTLNTDHTWSGRCVYGVNYNDVSICEPQFPLVNAKIIAVSSSESEEIKEVLRQNGYTTSEIAGAGYKLLSVVTGAVRGYVLSKPTSYMWDICACHAILDSIHGGIIDFTTFTPIKYRGGQGIKNCCNSGGIIAFRDENIKNELVEIFRKVH